MHVSGGKIDSATATGESTPALQALLDKFEQDPAAARLGELGFGTQILPVSGQDIQDEKVLGTVHVATGRSDHLGGDITPDLFKHKINASHDDILYSPAKTPEISVPQVRLIKGGDKKVLIEILFRFI